MLPDLKVLTVCQVSERERERERERQRETEMGGWALIAFIGEPPLFAAHVHHRHARPDSPLLSNPHAAAALARPLSTSDTTGSASLLLRQ